MNTKFVLKVSCGLILLILLIGTFLPAQAGSPVQPADLETSNDQKEYQIYLGGVSKDHAQCGVIPNLYSPSDGSTLSTSTPTFIFDGGTRSQANSTWLEFDLSQDPNFTSMYATYPSYFQPAQKDWVYPIASADAMEPGTYYWRAALWCNGPGWPPPPNPGEIRGSYSAVWSFTIEP